jgi:type IV secretory pathway VirB9-like protein
MRPLSMEKKERMSEDVATLIAQMREDWNARARQNAHYYVASGKEKWSESEFYESGRAAVSEEVLT